MTEGTSQNGASEAPKDAGATPQERPSAPRAGAGDGDGNGSSAGGDTSGDAGSRSAPGGGSGSGTGTTGPDGAPRKRRRRGKRGGKRHRKKPAGEGSATGSTDADGGGDAGDGSSSEKPAASGGDKPSTAGGTRTGSGSRSGGGSSRGSGGGGGTRSRSGGAAAKKPTATSDDAPATTADAGDPPTGGDAPTGDATGANGAGGEGGNGEGGDGTGAPRKRRRGRRGGRGRTKKPAGEGGDDSKASGDKKDDGEKKQDGGQKQDAQKGSGAARGGRSRSGSGRSGGGDSKQGSTRLRARQQRRDQRPRRPRKKLSEEEAALLRGQDKVMLIHQHDERTQIAVLEEGALIEHYVARAGARTTMAGNVYLGKVQNVLPGMEAAFIDFGRGRNGVLYAGEVNYSAEDLEGDQPKRIENVLKSGQKIMVQVTKDPIGNKGARLTTQVSLAGRYLVLAPDQQVTGISKRLAENERNRLRQILKDIRPNGHGVIVRTAAEGASKESLTRDLEHLVKTWEGIQKDSKRAKAPSELYSEPSLIMRVVRDEFSDDFTKLVVDTREVYEQVKSYLEEQGPDLLDKLELHEGALPLFEEHRVSEQLQKALERKVWLPSGGSIIIERTEALTVVDVNTGKFTGKGSNLEETVFANNLEAAEEIARQLRLRDIGGIIVIDFIDMIEQKNQREMLRTFKRHLSKDKTRSQVFEVSNLGLVEMTRKKVSEGLLDAFSEPCPNCDGRGIVITHEID